MQGKDSRAEGQALPLHRLNRGIIEAHVQGVTMTYHEMVVEIERLPLNEQLALLEALTRALRKTLTQSDKKEPVQSLVLVRGMLKPDGPMPTDEELKQDYTDYLIKKYL